MNTTMQTRGIAITGANSKYDQALTHGYFGSEATGLRPDRMTMAQALQLKANKWSVLAANEADSYAHRAESAGKANSVAELIGQQGTQMSAWAELLADAVQMFESVAASWTLMKALASPFALMSDIDFLVPEPVDIARITLELEIRGFRLYRFRLLAHPLKVMAVPDRQDIKQPPAIDIYPDGMWVRKHVIDGPGVVERRNADEVRGIKVYSPSPADDLYLVATHAFSHGAISLAELDHGTRLAAEGGSCFDWDQVVRMAEVFGCLNSVYVYLGLIERICEALGQDRVVPKSVVKSLAQRAVNRPIEGWLKRAGESLEFPLRVPLWISTVRSALYHLPAVLGKLRPRELVMDAAVHGFAVGTHLMRRD